MSIVQVSDREIIGIGTGGYVRVVILESKNCDVRVSLGNHVAFDEIGQRAKTAYLARLEQRANLDKEILCRTGLLRCTNGSAVNVCCLRT